MVCVKNIHYPFQVLIGLLAHLHPIETFVCETPDRQKFMYLQISVTIWSHAIVKTTWVAAKLELLSPAAVGQLPSQTEWSLLSVDGGTK